MYGGLIIIMFYQSGALSPSPPPGTDFMITEISSDVMITEINSDNMITE